MRRLIVAALFAGAQTIVGPAHASTLVAPVVLDAGEQITMLPNGFSSGDGIPETKPYDKTQSFSFEDGLAGALRARVIAYSDSPSHLHPGLYFDYEVSLTSGAVTSFSVSGWSQTETSVKVCGIAGCGGSGANGAVPTDVVRSSDGDRLTWDFSGLTAGEHSANLQIFSDARGFADPLASFTDSGGKTFSIDTIGPSTSSVPLPGSAPLYGAALLVLAACGYLGRPRRTAV